MDATQLALPLFADPLPAGWLTWRVRRDFIPQPNTPPLGRFICGAPTVQQGASGLLCREGDEVQQVEPRLEENEWVLVRNSVTKNLGFVPSCVLQLHCESARS